MSRKDFLANATLRPGAFKNQSVPTADTESGSERTISIKERIRLDHAKLPELLHFDTTSQLLDLMLFEPISEGNQLRPGFQYRSTPGPAVKSSKPAPDLCGVFEITDLTSTREGGFFMTIEQRKPDHLDTFSKMVCTRKVTPVMENGKQYIDYELIIQGTLGGGFLEKKLSNRNEVVTANIKAVVGREINNLRRWQYNIDPGRFYPKAQAPHCKAIDGGSGRRLLLSINCRDIDQSLNAAEVLQWLTCNRQKLAEVFNQDQANADNTITIAFNEFLGAMTFNVEAKDKQLNLHSINHDKAKYLTTMSIWLRANGGKTLEIQVDYQYKSALASLSNQIGEVIRDLVIEPTLAVYVMQDALANALIYFKEAQLLASREISALTAAANSGLTLSALSKAEAEMGTPAHLATP